MERWKELHDELYSDGNPDSVDVCKRIAALEAENARLREELAAIKGQEPVAWLHPYGGVLRKPDTRLERDTFIIPLIILPNPPKEQEQVEPAGRCSYCLTFNGHQDGCIKATNSNPPKEQT